MGVRGLVEAMDDLGRDEKKGNSDDGKRKREKGDENVDGDGDARKSERECKRRWVGDLAHRDKSSGGSGT